MAGHAVWPLVILGLVWIYRKSLSERFSQLRALRVGSGGIEAQFVESQLAQAINKASEAMEGETPPVSPEITADRDRAERIANISPRAAVLESFSREWIEAVFNVDPDGGDGSLERLIVVALAMVTVVFAVLARLEWRRMQPAYG